MNVETPAERRAKSRNSQEAYLSTIESVEPDITAIDASAFYASAAISLKRIADALDASGKSPETSTPIPYLDWQPIATFPTDTCVYLAIDNRSTPSTARTVFNCGPSRLSIAGSSIVYSYEFFTHWAAIPRPLP